MKEAAIAGIQAFGLGWKYKLSGLIAPEVNVLKTMNEKVQDDQDLTNEDEKALEDAVNSIVEKLRKWTESPKVGSDLKEALLNEIDFLEANADESIDEINYQMNRLYDVFDYYRVVVG